MSVNITLTGNIYNTSASMFSGTEVKYQLYFYKVNSTSSTSIWSSTRISEYGQYNINLGDSDILNYDGNANVGDKIIIAFWTPTTSLKTDNNLLEWGFTETVLTADTSYVQNVQLKSALTPTCDFTVNGSTTINHDVYANDVGSNDIHSWVFSGKTIYQEPSRYSQPIFYVMNTLQPSSSDVSWGDGNWSNNLDPSESYTHQYETPNSYDITTYVTNTSGLSASQTFMLYVYYNTPTCDFSIDNTTPNPIGTTGVGELVTFTNTTTDPDTRAVLDGWYCDWTIEDGDYTTTYTGKTLSYNPTHQFHSAGEHVITTVLHWYNGFSWATITTSKTITQQVWQVVNGLTWVIPVYVHENKLFSPNITGNTSYVSRVAYLIDGVPIFTDLGVNDSFNYTFHISTTHTVTQVIFYNNGFTNTTQYEVFTVLMSPVVDFIQSDDTCGDMYTSTALPGQGIIVMYKWKVYLNNFEVASLEGPTRNIFEYNWPTIGQFKILHTIIDSGNNTASELKTYNVNACKHEIPLPQQSNTGGYLIRETPMPKINCNLVGQFATNDMIQVNATLSSVQSINVVGNNK